MNKKVFASLLSLALLCVSAFLTEGHAQKTKAKSGIAKTTKQAVADPTLAVLPASDMIVTLDIKRLLTELVPKILSESPDKLAQFNAQLDKIKNQSGFDLKQIERITVGLKFIGAEKTKVNVEAVALARSSYNSSMLITGGKLIAKGKFREEKHGNKTITLFDIRSLKEKAAEAVQKSEPQPSPSPNQTDGKQQENPPAEKSIFDRIIGAILSQDMNELAVAPLDDKMLAIGKLSSVKAAINSSVAGRAKNAAVVRLASRNPSAIVSFGGNVPANLSTLLEVGGEFSKDIDSIRQLYGSIGLSSEFYDMNVSARAARVDHTKKLNDVVQLLKQLGGGYLQSRDDDFSKLGASLLQSLQIKHEGKDLHLKVEMKQTDVNALLKIF